MLNTWRSLSMLLFLVLLCLAVGQIGVFFTTTEAYNWYNTLLKPQWTPPSLLFPLIWTVLYVVMAVAAWLVWRRKNVHYRWALALWVIQLVLNGLWTPVFFGHQELLASIILMDVLWICLTITTYLFFKQTKWAGSLMLIYWGWVTYAGLLNFFIWQMNS